MTTLSQNMCPDQLNLVKWFFSSGVTHGDGDLFPTFFSRFFPPFLVCSFPSFFILIWSVFSDFFWSVFFRSFCCHFPLSFSSVFYPVFFFWPVFFRLFKGLVLFVLRCNQGLRLRLASRDFLE